MEKEIKQEDSKISKVSKIAIIATVVATIVFIFSALGQYDYMSAAGGRDTNFATHGWFSQNNGFGEELGTVAFLIMSYTIPLILIIYSLTQKQYNKKFSIIGLIIIVSAFLITAGIRAFYFYILE